MRYVIIDDEIHASSLLKRIIEKYKNFSSTDEIIVFNDSEDAYHYLLAEPVDLIFLDIQMPKMTGEELARKLVSDLDPAPYIVFTTAFPQYSLFAWDINAIGYILKPFSASKIYEAIEKCNKLQLPPANDRLIDSSKPFMQCFPDFELIINGSPVFFKNKTARELLALLVHNRGNWVSNDKITYCLFENIDEASAKNYLRTILHRLRKTLAEYNLEDIVESRYGSLRIDTSAFVCDYYNCLDGHKELFHGEYMGEYHWAETARAYLSRG